MDKLYLRNCSKDDKIQFDDLTRKLQRVCGLLDAILQSDRSRYLEARTWLLNSIAEQTPPADIRLACWEPLLGDAVAVPVPSPGATPPPQQAPPQPARADTPYGYGSPGTFGAGGSGEGGGGGGRGEGGCGGEGNAARGLDTRSGPDAQELLTQLLLLVSEVWPERVAALLLERPQVFVDFFRGPGGSRRVLLWFSHFSMEGMKAFKFGAYALAHYALAHREEVWDLLRWEGKHAQAPVAVAAKTHYFCELALQPTVAALLRHHPQFWASDQWRQCCRDGTFLELDRRHFALVLLSELRSGGPGGPSLMSLLRDFLSHCSSPAASWQLLCQRLLPQLTDSQLLALVNTMAAGMELQEPLEPVTAAPSLHSPVNASAATSTSSQPAPPPVAVNPGYAGVCGSGGWQDLAGLVLCGGVMWGSVAEAVLANALAAARGSLQRLLEEEREELGGRLEELEVAATELHVRGGGGKGRGGSIADEGGGSAGAAGDDSPYSAAAHQAMLYGSRWELRGPRSGADRLRLLTEVWTLREALRKGVARQFPVDGDSGGGGGGGGGGEASVPTTGTAAFNATRGGDALYGLESLMAQVRGISFERLHGARVAPQNTAVSAPPASRLVVPLPDGGGGGGVARGADAATGRYELLLSEDEEGEGKDGFRRSHHKSARRRGRSKKHRTSETEGDEDKEGRRRKRHGWKSKRRRQSTSSRSRSRSRRDAGRRGSRSESDRDRDLKRRRHRRRNPGPPDSSTPTDGSSTSGDGGSSSSDDSASPDDGGRVAGAGTGLGLVRHDGERCGSSKPGTLQPGGQRSGRGDRHREIPDGGRKRSRRRRYRRRRSGSREAGPRDSHRSSTLASRDMQGNLSSYDDDDDEQDPLTSLRARSGGARHGGAQPGGVGSGDLGNDIIWRVRILPSGGAGHGGSRALPGPTGASSLKEVVGGCDDVADLLAAVACKHWAADILLRCSGGGRSDVNGCGRSGGRRDDRGR